MTAFIDAYRQGFGVEPICRTLQVAPSTYYATPCRPPALLERPFGPVAPTHPRGAEPTYPTTHAGWVDVPVATDARSRRSVGWQASRPRRTDLALDALKMPLSTRRHEPLDN